MPIGAGAAFSETGFTLFEGAMSLTELNELERAFTSMLPGEAAARHFKFSNELLEHLVSQNTFSRLSQLLVGVPAYLCRVIAFDKTPAANWFVPWHQDRSIAVRERVEVEGYECWTRKDGHHHVEPPVEILEGMVTLRVHLDDSGEDSGPLEVIPGSHSCGRLERPNIEKVVATGDGHVCLARRGDILAMRPLLVHRSKRASRPGSRRVLHLEYSTQKLPTALQWVLWA